MKCDKCQIEVSPDNAQPIRTSDGTKNVCDNCIEDLMACDIFGLAGDFNKNGRGLKLIINPSNELCINGKPIPNTRVREVARSAPSNVYYNNIHGYHNTGYANIKKDIYSYHASYGAITKAEIEIFEER